MSQRSPQIAAPARSHEELFLARYAALREWAMRLAEGDRARAEDLVHDAFVHFTVARPELGMIENLDGYLFVMLRNLHTSNTRRAARLRDRARSIVEYDSAETSLRAADPRELIRVQDELRACCRYACARMDSSKAGSVLALRFFHGYYPREIAAVARSTRESVEERLRAARGEARQFLKDPTSLRFMHEARAREVALAPAGFVQTTDELLADLRRAIFDSRRGVCPSIEELARLYTDDGARGGVETKALAHLASCPRCMDEVNRLLGLPPLSERHPSDTAGADARPKDGSGGGDGDGDGGAGVGGGATEEDVSRCRRRARELSEHRPEELCLTVNGHVLAAQKTGAARCEQTLSVTLAEAVEFVEVFSEQEVRLLFLDVNEHLARGRDKYRASVALSDERTLEATLSFDEPWPTIQIVYEDPTCAPQVAAREASATLTDAHALREAVSISPEDVGRAANGEPTSTEVPTSTAARPRRARHLTGLLSKASRWFVGSKFLLRPATITAALAVFVVAALVLTRLYVPAVSAAELLSRAAGAEEKRAADAAVVLRRTFYLEESGGGGVTPSRRRVEVWQSAARGLKLRRVYDRDDKLVAGEWEKAGGARTIYTRGAAPRDADAPLDLKALFDAGELWRLEPSAETFGALVGDVKAATVEDGLGAYIINYSAGGPGEPGSLSRATLRLSKADLRATGQTLVLRGEGGEREYRFIESGFERLPAGRVEPGVFEPEPELLGARAGANGAGAFAAATTQDAAPSSSLSAAGAGAPAGAVATEELEVEAAYLLNRIKADLGEQVTWTRTAEGRLRVEALAETEGRKEEILRALGPVMRNPAVVVDVSTVAERLRRGLPTREGGESVREVEVRTGRMPADSELRRHFSARIAGDAALDEEIERFAARAMGRSRNAVLHASALKRLTMRFSPAEARSLAPEARGKWLAMVREHAQAVRREVRALDGELRPLFSPGTRGAGVERAEESNTTASAARLLQLAYSNDEAVRSAFTVSAGDGGTTALVKSAQFRRSLRGAAALAAAILEAYEK